MTKRLPLFLLLATLAACSSDVVAEGDLAGATEAEAPAEEAAPATEEAAPAAEEATPGDDAVADAEEPTAEGEEAPAEGQAEEGTEAAAEEAPAAGGPADIVYENAMVGNTTFSHGTHTGQSMTCDKCHPGLFEMKAKALKITMADMNAGKNCGSCHNGTTAFAASDCAKCHKK